MKRVLLGLILVGIFVSISASQVKRTASRRRTVAKATISSPAASVVPKGTVTGRTYTNKGLGFAITFPDTWLIPGDDFVAYMKKAGFDITPKPPKAANPADQKKVDAAFYRLKILMTAYRSMPGTEGNSVARVAVENVRSLNTTRPVKDAVDYVDLVHSQMSAVKMPADQKFSETQAEKLGQNQYAFIDTSDKSTKTRMYVTVRNGYAILFSLNYSTDEDLETFRDVLARTEFTIK
jgi:hypothetical protein